MSEEKSSLFVFDKKELVLLVIFFVVMAITTFVLGMRLGKNQAVQEFQQQPFSAPTSQKTAPQMKSEHEESIDDLLAEEVEGSEEADDSLGLSEETLAKLKEEFEVLDEQDYEPVAQKVEVKEEETSQAKTAEPQKTAVKTQSSEPAATEPKSVIRPTPEIMGKYTIQLGSYRSYDDAQEFANGFLIRNYQPIINEVEIEGKGIWYRVSLGVFETPRAARAYVEKEKSLFQNQDFIISQLQ